ncbi:cyclase family protein [Nitriliruptor alkaliphilus]|uniref:cyclase family protein n=1 Tax=Nitriliruptor alkaliphilus TaxID=427918 RepID=UPI0006960913|nr:cyclase family protein [Nitriliruptor alkaliphilus]
MPQPPTVTEHRVEFDATVTFANGGDLRVRGFRLDIPGDRIDREDVGLLLVRHLGLLMVGDIEVSNLRILAAPHKGSRGGPSDGTSTAAQTTTALIDLSHVIVEGMVTYPGLPGPSFHDHLTREASRDHYAPGTEFAIQRLEMVGNTGTYLDSPFHRYADGGDLAALDLATLVDLPAAVVHLDDSEARGIGPTALASFDVRGHAVLLHTGWDRHWGTERYGDPAPFLTQDGARYLADEGAALVGIDSVNIDDTVGRARPAHSILLEACIPVVEHLTGLGQLPASGVSFSAVPPRVAGFGTFPVRAYARIPA